MTSWGKQRGGRKNHIKYAFFLRSKSEVKYSKNNETPKYLFAYLTDDNKVFFDEFHLKDRTYFRRGTVRQFVKKIKKRYMDENTLVHYYFGEGRFKMTDLIFMLWSLYHLGTQFTMLRTPLGVVAKRIDLFFHLGLPKFRKKGKDISWNVAFPRVCEIYDIILKNRICPWINDEFNQRIELIKPSRRKMYKAVTVGLLHMVANEIYTTKNGK